MGSLLHKCQLHWSVLLLLIMTSCCTAAKKCTQDEHLQNNKCVKCPVCPRGQGLSEECGYGHGTNATCISCVEGQTFSKDENSATCTPCRQCSLYKREVRYQCRAVVDSECGGCLPQFYEYSWRSPGRLQPCEKCSSEKDHSQCASQPNHVTTQDSDDTTQNYPEDQSGDQYKIATVLLGVMLALALITIAFLVFLVAHISKRSSGSGVTPFNKGDFGRANRGESFTDSLQGKNEDENLLISSRHFRGNVEDHQYEVVVENVKPPDNVVDFITTQELPHQHSPLDGTAPCSHDDITASAHGPASGNFIEEEPQSPEVTQSQMVIVHSGEPQIAETTTAVPTFSSPAFQDANVNEGMPSVSQVPTSTSDGDDGDDDRDSNCASEASTLLVRNCDHGDAIHIEPCNIVPSGETHGMNSLNNFDSEPNRPILNFQPNISGRIGHGATPIVSWKKNSGHASSGKPPDLARPNLTIADLQDVGTTSPEIQQQKHDVASIQITINNTIGGGQPVLNNASVPPSLDPETDVGQEDTDTTAVKSIMNASLFTRSCSMEERASNLYSVPVQESMMELKA